MAVKPKGPDVATLAKFLTERHAAEATRVQPLQGGFWSSAYAYEADGASWVLRLGNTGEGFAIDRDAMQFAGPGLPIPNVMETGFALGHHYAISRRHLGEFVETRSNDMADAVGEALAKLLTALRSVASGRDEPVVWYDANNKNTWREWLSAAFLDRPGSATAGWRQKLAGNPPLQDLFHAVEAKIVELLPACPERRDLVHGDLLHQNVLVGEDCHEVTGIFSWKCSARGDFLYDVAWCTLWSDWHPVIAGADMWTRTLAAPDLSDTDLKDAALRHHCYELQIAAVHFGWYLWTGDSRELDRLARLTEAILSRGPRAL